MPEPVGQGGAGASSQIVEGHVESGGRGARAPRNGAGLHGGCGLRHENTRRKNGEADDDNRQQFDQA